MTLAECAEARTTPGMRHRGLQSVAAEREHAIACARGNARWEGDPYPAALVERRVAAHKARVAWAEVEYAAWRAGNGVGLTYRPRKTLLALLDQAYAADAAHTDALRAFRRAEDARP